MKKVFGLTQAVLILSVLCVACKKEETVEKEATKLELSSELISLATAELEAVDPPSGGSAEGWEGMTLAFNEITDAGGTVEVSGAKELFNQVWNDETFVWRWNNDEGTQVQRSTDGQLIDIVSLTADELTLAIDVETPASGARTSIIGGQWTFVFNLTKDN